MLIRDFTSKKAKDAIRRQNGRIAKRRRHMSEKGENPRAGDFGREEEFIGAEDEMGARS